MVLIRNWQIFHILVLGEIGQGNLFHDILLKNACVDYKKKSKKSKKRDFSKGVSLSFWSKNWQFFLFLFQAKYGKLCFLCTTSSNRTPRPI